MKSAPRAFCTGRKPDQSTSQSSQRWKTYSARRRRKPTASKTAMAAKLSLGVCTSASPPFSWATSRAECLVSGARTQFRTFTPEALVRQKKIHLPVQPRPYCARSGRSIATLVRCVSAGMAFHSEERHRSVGSRNWPAGLVHPPAVVRCQREGSISPTHY